MAVFCAIPLILLTGSISAAENSRAESARNLGDLSIEELMNETVTSVSRREQKLGDAASAIFVLSNDDLLRSGVTTFADALRLVPGMDVAQIDSHTWAVSARGFEGQFANKLLVMIDGRTIYESAFAGVKWEVQDMVFEDLDRIEVIRGPGATLWGANAVNGVVNIITKSARETQGALLSSTVDSEGQYSTSVRYGGQLASNVHYRVYGKYFSHEGLVTATGDSAPDEWSIGRGGFRLDWDQSSENTLTLQGECYRDESTKTMSVPLLVAPYSRTFNGVNHNGGGNLLGRWTHTFSSESQLAIQTYYTHSQFAIDYISPKNDTFDFDLQDRFRVGSQHDIVWGAGYRLIADDFPPDSNWTWDPRSSKSRLYTTFFQDEITLIPDHLRISLGSKFEHNDQTGFEAQPSARMIWTPTERQSLWAAVSRAVRTPDRFEEAARRAIAAFPTGPTTPPAEVDLVGNADVRAEGLKSYEFGYRVEVTKRLSFDATVFYNQYDDLIDFVPEAPNSSSVPVLHTILPQVTSNVRGGNSQGVEIAVKWSVTDNWRLAADYSYLCTGFAVKIVEYDNPQHQAHLRSYVTLPRNLELNGVLSFVDRLRRFEIPSYVGLDLGVVWHATESLDVGIWGRNLLKNHHPEFHDFTTSVSEDIPRTVTAKVTVRF